MDATKAAAWIAENLTAHTDQLFAGQYRHDPLPFALVGLTAGTGSEVSPVAVLTCPDGRKRSVSDPRCYARMAFGDPRYTDSLGRVTTEASALDAFCHAAEGYLNPACGDAAQLFAEKALPLLSDGLEALARLAPEERPEPGLRDRLYYGSLWAGMVLNALGTSYPHPLGYVLTEDFGVPHGAACAVFLPDLLARTAVRWPERAASFDSLTGGRDRVLPLIRKLPAPILPDPGTGGGYAWRWDPEKGGACLTISPVWPGDSPLTMPGRCSGSCLSNEKRIFSQKSGSFAERVSVGGPFLLPLQRALSGGRVDAVLYTKQYRRDRSGRLPRVSGGLSGRGRERDDLPL